MRLCKDCKHYQPNEIHKGRCGAPQNVVMIDDFVNGGKTEGDPKFFYACNLNRKDEKACGPDATWFEARNGS